MYHEPPFSNVSVCISLPNIPFTGLTSCFSASSIIDSHPIVTQGRLRIVHLLIAGGIGLTIVGAEMTGSTDESKRNEGSTFRKIGGVVLIVDVIILTLIDWVFWQAKHEFMEYQRTVSHSYC